MSARLHRALSKDPKIKVGSLVAPSGKHMQSKGNTLELLLATHFPNSVVTENMAASAAAHHIKQCDWWVALEVVIYGRVEWAINSFAPLSKSRNWWHMSGPVARGMEDYCPYLVWIFCAC